MKETESIVLTHCVTELNDSASPLTTVVAVPAQRALQKKTQNFWKPLTLSSNFTLTDSEPVWRLYDRRGWAASRSSKILFLVPVVLLREPSLESCLPAVRNAFNIRSWSGTSSWMCILDRVFRTRTVPLVHRLKEPGWSRWYFAFCIQHCQASCTYAAPHY